MVGLLSSPAMNVQDSVTDGGVIEFAGHKPEGFAGGGVEAEPEASHLVIVDGDIALDPVGDGFIGSQVGGTHVDSLDCWCCSYGVIVGVGFGLV